MAMDGALLPATPLVPVPAAELLALAAELQGTGRGPEAERLADHVLAVLPNQADALHVKGLVAYKNRRLDEAARLFERALEHGLEASLYWRNICTVYERLNRLDEAVAAGQRAVALDPTDATAYHNLTIAHYRRLDLDEMMACARTSLRLDPSLPGAHFALAESLLLRGAFDEGWREYEWRFRIDGAAAPLPRNDRPAWDGSAMPAGLLLVADQGFGDVIQFARYVPWALTRCPGLVIACSPETRPLLARLVPQRRLFCRWEECPEFAAFCTLSGLPRLHGTKLDSIPPPVADFHADPHAAATWRERLAELAPRGYRRVGIVWAGRPEHNNDVNRSATLAAMAPIAEASRVALVSLQKGPAQAQVGRYHGRAPLLNVAPDLHSFEDTAAVIANLDVVVGVDTAVMHLAGALGKPAWIMLPFAPDWRWLLGRTDSPWYPTAKLFRQTAPRRWDDVATAVAEGLAEGSADGLAAPR